MPHRPPSGGIRALAGARLSRLVSRFWRDERGAFAVTFTVLAIVLTAMAGSAVDFTSLQHARTRAQSALDAVSLALEPSIYTATAATLQSEAQALLVNRLADAATTWADCSANGGKAPCATVATPGVDTTNGQLTLTATVKVPMYFVSLVGIPTISANVVSGSTRKKLALEIAMVLDNSGSMSTSYGTGTRMSVLQASATCAVNILFYAVSTCTAATSSASRRTPTIKIGVVPFTMEVNVGTGNANASWLDRQGTTTDSITADEFRQQQRRLRREHLSTWPGRRVSTLFSQINATTARR